MVFAPSVCHRSLPVPSEAVPRVIVRETVLSGDQALVSGDGAIDTREVGQAPLHSLRKLANQLADVRDDSGDALIIKLNRLGNIVEDAQVVDDQAVRLGLPVGSIRAADSLEQGVITQGLIEIHRL